MASHAAAVAKIERASLLDRAVCSFKERATGRPCEEVSMKDALEGWRTEVISRDIAKKADLKKEFRQASIDALPECRYDSMSKLCQWQARHPARDATYDAAKRAYGSGSKSRDPFRRQIEDDAREFAESHPEIAARIKESLTDPASLLRSASAEITPGEDKNFYLTAFTRDGCFQNCKLHAQKLWKETCPPPIHGFVFEWDKASDVYFNILVHAMNEDDAFIKCLAWAKERERECAKEQRCRDARE